MSDIQRYKYFWSDELGDADVDGHEEYYEASEADAVINKLQQQLSEAQAKVTSLQSQLEHERNMNEILHGSEKQLKAKAHELENQLQMAISAAVMTDKHENQIKADGIREIGLPKIDDVMWEMFSETQLMAWDKENKRPYWTQDAVDVLCYFRNWNADNMENNNENN